MSTNEFAAFAALDLAPIKMKLMHVESGEGWSALRANTVETEYRRFLFLMKKYPDAEASPTVDVDIFWHYHILDTMKYARDCDTVFGYFLHHYPYVGIGAASNDAEQLAGGERMRQIYEAEFGAGPAANADAYCTSPGKPTQAANAAFAYCTSPGKPGKAANAAWAYCTSPGKAANAAHAYCTSPGKPGDAANAAWAYCTSPGTPRKAAYAYCTSPGKPGDAANAAWAYCTSPGKAANAASAYCTSPGKAANAASAYCTSPGNPANAAWAYCTSPGKAANAASAYCTSPGNPVQAQSEAAQARTGKELAHAA